MAQLRPIAEPLRRWYQVITEENIPELGENVWWLKSAVASRIYTDELGAPVPNGGYHLVTMTALPTGVPQINQVLLDVFAGGRFINRANLQVMRGQPMDGALLIFSFFRQIVLAIERLRARLVRRGPFQPL